MLERRQAHVQQASEEDVDMVQMVYNYFAEHRYVGLRSIN